METMLHKIVRIVPGMVTGGVEEVGAMESASGEMIIVVRTKGCVVRKSDDDLRRIRGNICSAIDPMSRVFLFTLYCDFLLLFSLVLLG